MKSYHSRIVVSILLFALMLISCGGSGGGMIAGGGIGGTGIISSGVVSAFGSIFVNGTEFDTSNAVIVVNGEEIGVGDEIVLDNLDIGRVVTVEGTLNGSDSDAVADRVYYKNNVEGPVEGVSVIDDTTKEIVVLSQTVIVNVITKFKETAFDTIAKDDVVEISGYLDDTGAIRATFLGKTGDITTILEYEVTGFVVNLDTDLKTFEINDLTVDYSLADTNDLPGGVPADGLLVEVEGPLDAAGGELIATKIELGDELDTDNADQIEVMGFVTDLVSVFEFNIGRQVVVTDDNTVYVDGTAADIAPGVKLEAEGSLIDGILFANEIEFWDPDQIEVEGVVTNIVSVSEFTVGDQAVQTDSGTVFEGGTADDITLGVLLEVKGFPIDIDHTVLLADKVSFEQE